MTVQIAYDIFAAECAERVRHELDSRPLERGLLSAAESLLTDAGFVPHARLEREAHPDEKQAQGFVLAREVIQPKVCAS